eukprot:9719063-Alexandrium_andersonii.AAC.1
MVVIGCHAAALCRGCMLYARRAALAPVRALTEHMAAHKRPRVLRAVLGVPSTHTAIPCKSMRACVRACM